MPVGLTKFSPVIDDKSLIMLIVSHIKLLKLVKLTLMMIRTKCNWSPWRQKVLHCHFTK